MAEKSEFEFVKNLGCLESGKYIEKYFLFSASPVITGVKPSVLVSFKLCCYEVWTKQKKHLEDITGFCTYELYKNCETFSMLIYSGESLALNVQSNAAQKILDKHGYTQGELENLLSHLANRFNNCKFPHEIGVFLGYPPEDVRAFIEKKGRDYLCCRYWKVYHNEKSAREIFGFIDAAKARAIQLLTQQIPTYAVVKMLAEMQTC